MRKRDRLRRQDLSSPTRSVSFSGAVCRHEKAGADDPPHQRRYRRLLVAVARRACASRSASWRSAREVFFALTNEQADAEVEQLVLGGRSWLVPSTSPWRAM